MVHLPQDKDKNKKLIFIEDIFTSQSLAPYLENKFGYNL